uniref:Uncharacterized protein n=1 Tax=Oryza rufipogon TaxID=4529 RepID=A0A0E0N837_ORYRU
MDRQLVGVLAVLVAVCAVAAVQAQPPSPKLPPNYHMINPGHMGGKRDQQLSCDDTQGKKKGCMAKCDKRCPNQCIVMCPSCKTFCMCDFYPGVSCGDPRFTGGDGNNFYFHGKKDHDFCIDSRIHNYGVTEEDSLAHLDIGFKFYDLSDDVHGVLGQTYRSDYVNKLSVSASMPVMGGAPSYVASDIFSTDCAVARFGRRAGISMAPSSPRLPSNYHVINPGRFGKRDQQLSCTDSNGNKAVCMAKCDKRCPNQCIVMCPGCKTFCMCDFYPGVSCGDPRFTGGDGNNFYFHGKKDHDFCIVSDADLHINAHFIGKRNPTMSRDFTWIQALGIRFADHRLYMGALKTAKWNSDDDRLELAFDGAPVDVPAELGARWESAAVPGLTVTRTAATNAVRVQLAGVLDIMANVVPITEQDSRIHNYGDSRIHNYGVTEEDSLAHLDLGFKFYDLSDDVHGVLGQTYRSDYVNNLSVSASMPVMGGAPSYVVSDIFSTDCAVARFGRRAGISMVTGRAN